MQLNYVVAGIIVIGLLIAIGAFGSDATTPREFEARSNAPDAVATQSPPTGTGSRASVTETSSLYDRQRDCAARLPQFIESKSRSSSGAYSNASQFVVGYSPARNTCIGGYQITVGTPGAQFRVFEIVDLNTNLTIINHGADEAAYKASLTQLSDGQIR